MSHALHVSADSLEGVEHVFATMREHFMSHQITGVDLWLSVDSNTRTTPVPISIPAPVPVPVPVPQNQNQNQNIQANRNAVSLSEFGYENVISMIKEKRQAALLKAIASKGKEAVLSKLLFLTTTPKEYFPRGRIFQEDYSWVLEMD